MYMYVPKLVVRTLARSTRTQTRTHELTKDMVSKAELPLLSFSNLTKIFYERHTERYTIVPVDHLHDNKLFWFWVCLLEVSLNIYLNFSYLHLDFPSSFLQYVEKWIRKKRCKKKDVSELLWGYFKGYSTWRSNFQQRACSLLT